MKLQDMIDLMLALIPTMSPEGALEVYKEMYDLTKQDYQELGVLPTSSVKETVRHYHGVSMWSREGGDSMDNLNTLFTSKPVISGSNKALGNIGIVFNGFIHRAHLSDCGSTIKSRESVDRGVYVSSEQFSIASKIYDGVSRGYMETFSVVESIEAIWIDYSKVDRDTIKSIECFAQEVGVSVVEKSSL